MRRAPVMSAVAAMIVHARKHLDRSTASHLVANATSPYVMAIEGADVGPLVPLLDALRARARADVEHGARSADYPYRYPLAPDALDALLVELAAIWSAYEQGHVPDDLLRTLRRAHVADPTVSFKVRLRAGRWYVTAKRGREVLAQDDHHMAEVAIGEVLRCLPPTDSGGVGD